MYDHSAIALSDLFKKGEASAQTIVQACLKRIAQHDVAVGAFLSVCSDRALAQAEKIDAKRKKGEALGRLAGVPIAIKDNMHVEGEITTCGSRFLSNYRAPFSATAIELLEQEDAIIIGKTNLDEFAMGSSTENSAYQLTKNPWDLSCTPGGSSGGSAAAVSARLVPLAFGSDTGGSIRQPAALTGIVGYKPTYGRVSRYGLVAFGSSLDQIGPFSTTVADTALVMEILGRHCRRDATSISSPAENHSQNMKKSLKETVVGVPWNFIQDLSSDAKENFSQAIETLKSQGCSIVEVDLGLLKYSIAIYYILATAEASTNLARFDGIRYGVRSNRAKTLEEVYDFSKQEGFGAEVKNRILLGTYVLSAGYQDAYYRKAQKVRSLILRQYAEAFKKCSIIAMPVSPFPAFPIGSIQDPLQMYLQDIYTISANLAGIPAISVPSGFNADNKPFGLQILGPQMRDADVLQAAYQYEQATQYTKKIPPLFGNEALR